MSPTKGGRELSVEILRAALLKRGLKRLAAAFKKSSPRFRDADFRTILTQPEFQQLANKKEREVDGLCEAYCRAMAFRREHHGRVGALDRERAELEREKAGMAKRRRDAGTGTDAREDDLEKQWERLGREREAFELECRQADGADPHAAEIREAYSDIRDKRRELEEQERWVQERLRELTDEKEQLEGLVRDVVELLEAHATGTRRAARLESLKRRLDPSAEDPAPPGPSERAREAEPEAAPRADAPAASPTGSSGAGPAHAEREELEVDRLLRYTIKGTIGVGGMGTVYLGEEDQTKRPVAVKVLAKRFAADAGFMRRFQHEADVAARLRHENIARAFSVGEEHGFHFYVMEFCEGETLADRIARDGGIPTDAATRIIIQIARGLRHAHEAGLIHRDIKPSNVRVSPAGKAKILDFGFSKRIGDVELYSGERHGAIGSPHYMSPEQVRREPRIDGRADIYSLGATYYHCVTGDTPFHGRNATEIVAQHLGRRPRDPRDIRKGIPVDVARVILRMMAKSPSDRHLNCKVLLEDLERVADTFRPRGRPPRGRHRGRRGRGGG
jgi:serine/threonine-protein kinase